MVFEDFLKALEDLKFALDVVVSNNVHLDETYKSSILDFKSNKKEYYKRAFMSSLDSLVRKSFVLKDLVNYDSSNEVIVNKMLDVLSKFKNNTKHDQIKSMINSVENLSGRLSTPRIEKLKLKPSYLPDSIRSEVLADLEEIEKCFNADCYRSAVIMCGRVLETCLHRRYFEVTGNDLLEKSPGIGLGSLIAKMSDNGVKLDPGLSNQIHLINNVRIFSVHKKQRPFYPSRSQAYAIILYTVDIADKLFSKN